MELSGSETVVFCSLEESPVEWQVHVELPDQSTNRHRQKTTPLSYTMVPTTTLWCFCSTHLVFTTRCYASAVLAMSLCPSVSMSVTSRCSNKTAKRRITQTTPHDAPGTLVFWCQRSQRNSTGVTPYGGAKCRWGGQNRRLSTNNRLYLENGTR